MLNNGARSTSRSCICRFKLYLAHIPQKRVSSGFCSRIELLIRQLPSLGYHGALGQALAGCLCFCFVFTRIQSWTTVHLSCESGITKQSPIKIRKPQRSCLLLQAPLLLSNRMNMFCQMTWALCFSTSIISEATGCPGPSGRPPLKTLTVCQGIPVPGRQLPFGWRECLPREWSPTSEELRCRAMRRRIPGWGKQR